MRPGRAELRELRSLRTARGRRETGRFTAEGVRALEEAFRHGVLPERIYHGPPPHGERESRWIHAAVERGVPVVEMTASQLASVADAKTPQGLLGVFVQSSTDLDDLLSSRPERLLVLDGVADPGNVGTLVRSAVAFGFDGVIAMGDVADPWAPKVTRASAGAVFALPIVRVDSARGTRALRGAAIHAIALSSAGEAREEPPVVDPPFALCVGSEAHGLGEDVVALARETWTLPVSRAVESLNAAVAGSIAMYALRAR